MRVANRTSPCSSPLPSQPATPQVSVGPEDPAIVVATLRRNLDLLQTLASERAAMEEAIKEQKKKDNIMPKLMATPPQVRSSIVDWVQGRDVKGGAYVDEKEGG